MLQRLLVGDFSIRLLHLKMKGKRAKLGVLAKREQQTLARESHTDGTRWESRATGWWVVGLGKRRMGYGWATHGLIWDGMMGWRMRLLLLVCPVEVAEHGALRTRSKKCMG